MTYQPLPFVEFSRRMINSKDLDPVYVAAREVLADEDQRKRWLLAYGLFYHVGAASYFSEFQGLEFWHHIHRAAANTQPTPLGTRWPRASERRHFRGAFAVDCVARMEERHPHPENFMERMVELAPDVGKVRKYVESHKGFGGWASFKFADLIDRVVDVPVEFDTTTAFYDTPIEGAYLLWVERNMPITVNHIGDIIDFSVGVMKNELSHLMAPPFYDRPMALNELETCLCKFKSHTKGRYPIGKDIAEGLHMAGEWKKISPTANGFYRSYQQMDFNLKNMEQAGWV